MSPELPSRPPETQPADRRRTTLAWATPLRVLVLVLGAVFLGELLLMLVLTTAGPLPPLVESLLDAGVLTACLFPVLWLLVFRVVAELRQEVAERKRISEELRRAVVAAQAAAQAKTEFLANMSHEIRTPMNGVLGMLDLVLEDRLSPPSREYLEVARTSAQSLLRILNDILDFAKAEAGKLSFDTVAFQVRPLVREAAESLAVTARQKGLDLSLRFEPGTPAVIVGDPGRLKQVLLNLVGNALKFTDRGGVAVRVSPAPGPMGFPADDRGTALLFSVADTGPGIPREAQEKLFQSFSQVDGSTTRRHMGTGLGLAICREIIECMGGSIRVDSEPGRGSLFSFTASFGLPDESASGATAPEEPTEVALVRAAPTAGEPGNGVAPAPARATAVAAGPRRRVLLAEDMPANQMLAVALLRKRGWEVDTVVDGAEAVEAWARGGYDLVLMDVQMPGMDGFEASRRIREREQGEGSHTPIVAMTAHALEGDRERCLAAGMDGYVSKPVDQGEFFRTIDQCLAGRPGAARPGASPPADLPRALRALGGDAAILDQLCRYFLQEHSGQVAALTQAVERREAKAVEMAAHRLKSAVGHFRAEAAWDLAQALERMGREDQLDGAEELLPILQGEVEALSGFLSDRFPAAAPGGDAPQT